MVILHILHCTYDVYVVNNCICGKLSTLYFGTIILSRRQRARFVERVGVLIITIRVSARTTVYEVILYYNRLDAFVLCSRTARVFTQVALAVVTLNLPVRAVSPNYYSFLFPRSVT